MFWYHRIMRIPRPQFDACIRSLTGQPVRRDAGFFGPQTEVWRLARESLVMLGGGRAALLQAAHPYVAWAVMSHSAVMTDVAGRFRRTFENVFDMVFGTTDQALERAQLVRRIHEHVNGTIDEDVGRFRRGDAYDALDAEATLWVAATLWDTMMLVHELLIDGVTPQQQEQFYRESMTFLELFGLTESVVPATWADFRVWFDGMLSSDTIAVGEAAREICRHIIKPPRPAAKPAYAWLEVFTGAILPERLRDEYGFEYGLREKVIYRTSTGVMRRTLPLVPDRLRYFPAYLDARRRLAGVEGRDPVGEFMERVVLAGLTPSSG